MSLGSQQKTGRQHKQVDSEQNGRGNIAGSSQEKNQIVARAGRRSRGASSETAARTVSGEGCEGISKLMLMI